MKNFDDLDFSDVKELNFDDLERDFYSTFEDSKEINETERQDQEDYDQEEDDQEDYDQEEDDQEDYDQEDYDQELDDYLDSLGFDDYEETGN